MEYLARYAQFVLQIFSVRYLPLHAVGIIATLVLVSTGLDWAYLVYVLHAVPTSLLYVADVTGFLVPVFLLIGSIIVLCFSHKKRNRIYAEAMLYAILLGFTLSTIIKAFTGRESPPHRHRGEELILIDNSNGFDFGFMNHHVIGGWPSSHTTIAFALATVLTMLLPRRWYLQVIIFASAVFIGLGVTFGYHWLSEFVAGACLGIAVGTVVGSYYKAKL